MSGAVHLVYLQYFFNIEIDGPDTFSKTGKIFGEFANKITELVLIIFALNNILTKIQDLKSYIKC